jgi:hypothetical protein
VMELQLSGSFCEARRACANEQLDMNMCARSSSRTVCCPTRLSWCALMAEDSPSTIPPKISIFLQLSIDAVCGCLEPKMGAAAAYPVRQNAVA